MPIRGIFARQIFDSRGDPTVEVDLITELGLFRVGVPTAKNATDHEAVELRDHGPRYNGFSVYEAIKNVMEVLGPTIKKSKFQVTQQTEIDQLMLILDGTKNKSKLGVNAILGVSLAVALAGAATLAIPLYRHFANLAGNKEIVLPIPSFNVINGGMHAGNKLAIQEIIIEPIGASSFSEAMRMGTDVYYYLGLEIQNKYGMQAATVGDMGGYALNVDDAKTALQLVMKAIEKAGFTDQISISIDAAASKFYKNGLYDLDFKNPKSDKKKWLKSEKLMEMYQDYIKKFPIVCIEDPFHYNDWTAWSTFMEKNPNLLIAGDDLTATSSERIKEAIEKKACNCLLIKINHVGTVTEAIQAYRLAKENGWEVIVGHRSGDTGDHFMADFSVGLSTGRIKAGAPSRSERLSKYNQILRIEEQLGSAAKYAGIIYRKKENERKEKEMKENEKKTTQ